MAKRMDATDGTSREFERTINPKKNFKPRAGDES
jgi:hypothetical protein